MVDRDTIKAMAASRHQCQRCPQEIGIESASATIAAHGEILCAACEQAMRRDAADQWENGAIQ